VGRSPRRALLARLIVVRGLPTLLGPSPTTDVFGDGVALGDDLLGGGGVDEVAVAVTQFVGRASVEVVQARSASLGATTLQRLGVHGALVDRLVVVDGGESGVVVSGGFGAERINWVRSSRLPVLDIGWPLRSVSRVSEARGVKPR
jgi:hypothetical protein